MNGILTPDSLVPPPHLSPSSMSTFHQCPLKFRYSKIDKIPDSPSEATLLGNFVHDVCEQFYMREPEERTRELLKQLLRSVWNVGDWENRIHPYVVGKHKVIEFMHRALWAAENLWAVENPVDINPEGLEYELNGEVNGVTLKGFIDRLSFEEDGAVISDYKTGKVPKPQYGDKFLQLKIYGTLIDELKIAKTARLELLYLKDGVRFDYEFTQKDFDETVEYVTETKKAIDIACVSHEFKTNKTFLCNWCAYKPQCPAWRRK